MPDRDNRGRVQAQGGGVEESVPWARETPPTVEDGHLYLNNLSNMLSASERHHREQAFHEAHRHVDRAGAAGGMSFGKKSFPLRARADHRRVDIEIQKGIAFISTPVETEDD